jgi:hypothetical protein
MTAYKIKLLAEAIPARREEIFHYKFDLANFRFMLNRTPDEAFAKDLQKRIADSKIQLARAELILEALFAQVDTPEIAQALREKGIIE